jgi:hypothetical protein
MTVTVNGKAHEVGPLYGAVREATINGRLSRYAFSPRSGNEFVLEFDGVLDQVVAAFNDAKKKK